MQEVDIVERSDLEELQQTISDLEARINGLEDMLEMLVEK